MIRAASFLWICLALTLSGCATGQMPQQTQQTNWVNYLARNATVAWTGPDGFTLNNVRNFEWGENGATRERWESRSYDVGRVAAIWFNVEPFPAAPSLAHTFLTFEFSSPEPDFLTVSVEARRRIGEDYSPLRGLQGAYELIFAWSTEKDILTDAVVRLGHEIEMYRVNVNREQAQRILRGFLARTQHLAERPERYNTLRHNCTTELAAVVNREFGERIPWDISFVLTSGSSKYLHRLGYLGDRSETFTTLRARSKLSRLVPLYTQLPERRFSATLRRNKKAWTDMAERD